jgi:selenocysteine-specific elongation factor
VRRLDVRLHGLQALKHWTPVHVHIGAAHAHGRVALLDDGGLAQLVLDQPVSAVRGDAFIVRDQPAQRTLGGGRVIDIHPPPRGRAKPARLAWLRGMELEDDAAALDALLELSPLGVDLARFAANRNLPPMSGWRFSAAHWRAWRENLLARLAAWHAAHPDAFGMPEERRLPPGLVDELVREGRVVRQGAALRLASHRVQLAPEDAALWQKLEPLLAGLRPPSLGELATRLAMDPKKLEAALARAARHGLVARVSKNRFFLPAALARLEATLAAQARSGPVTAAAFRDRSGIGRNAAIDVLEYFDRIQFTRRVGDTHVWIGNRGQSPISNDS